MGTKLKGFRLPIEIASKLEDLAKTKKYSSEAFIVSKALEEFFDSLEKKPPASTEKLETQLRETLQEIGRLRDMLKKETECFSRFEHEGINYCAKNAPRIVELPTLKICKACRFKITTETLTKELPQIQHYYSCGATERIDEKAGITWLFCKNPNCPEDLRGRWHTTQACKERGCPLLKTVLIKKKR